MRIGLAGIAVFASVLSLGAVTGSPVQAQQLNPCPFTADGDCDEPNGLDLCAWGTDPVDCSNPNSNFGSGTGFAQGAYTSAPTPAPAPAPAPTQTQGLSNPCPFTNDGDCDEPNGLGLCAWGTDAVDCSNPNSNFGNGSGFAGGATQGLANPCPFTNDGDCDEPNGLGLCAWGTDAADCSNPNSNFGSGSGFAGRINPTPAPPVSSGTSGGFVSSGRGGSIGCPNYSIQNTAFGEGTLTAGGAVSAPVRVPRITAGGRFALADCFPGTGWRGYTITRPDYRFFYQGSSPTGRLTFSLISNATDTVLLINTPDGQWHFNDDSNGSFNSTLTFSPVLQGQYDIWTGSYNRSSNNAAQLWISEQ